MLLNRRVKHALFLFSLILHLREKELTRSRLQWFSTTNFGFLVKVWKCYNETWKILASYIANGASEIFKNKYEQNLAKKYMQLIVLNDNRMAIIAAVN